MRFRKQPRSLLSDRDPNPVEWVNPDSTAPVFLLCEHAGQVIPEALGDLGLPKDVIDTHIGWDIGAEKLARAMAERLDAPLVLQRYSRLVIDCNRPLNTPASIPLVSDHVTIPANQTLSASDRRERQRHVFTPLERAVKDGFLIHPRRAAFSIHSFTPSLDGQSRPWHAGFLARRDTETADALRNHVASVAPDLNVATNQPYQIDDETDWFIPAHAEPRNLAHSLIEIRNDQLGSKQGISRWASLLADAISSVLEYST